MEFEPLKQQILNHLNSHKRTLTPEFLAAFFDTDISTVTQALTELVQAGMVEELSISGRTSQGKRYTLAEDSSSTPTNSDSNPTDSSGTDTPA